MRAIPRGSVVDFTVPCGQKNAARLAVRPSFDRALKVYWIKGDRARRKGSSDGPCKRNRPAQGADSGGLGRLRPCPWGRARRCTAGFSGGNSLLRSSGKRPVEHGGAHDLGGVGLCRLGVLRTFALLGHKNSRQFEDHRRASCRLAFGRAAEISREKRSYRLDYVVPLLRADDVHPHVLPGKCPSRSRP